MVNVSQILWLIKKYVPDVVDLVFDHGGALQGEPEPNDVDAHG